MSDFMYEEPFSLQKDDTQYRKITSEYVKKEKMGYKPKLWNP